MMLIETAQNSTKYMDAVPTFDVSPVTPRRIVVIPVIPDSHAKPSGSNRDFRMPQATPIIARPRKSSPAVTDTPTLAKAAKVPTNPTAEIANAGLGDNPLKFVTTVAKLYQHRKYVNAAPLRITMVNAEGSARSCNRPMTKRITAIIPDQSIRYFKCVPVV